MVLMKGVKGRVNVGATLLGEVKRRGSASGCRSTRNWAACWRDRRQLETKEQLPVDLWPSLRCSPQVLFYLLLRVEREAEPERKGEVLTAGKPWRLCCFPTPYLHFSP